MKTIIIALCFVGVCVGQPDSSKWRAAPDDTPTSMGLNAVAREPGKTHVQIIHTTARDTIIRQGTYDMETDSGTVRVRCSISRVCRWRFTERMIYDGGRRDANGRYEPAKEVNITKETSAKMERWTASQLLKCLYDDDRLQPIEERP